MEKQIKKEDKSKSKGETVLLRYPMPKYSFQGRKLEKTDVEKREEGKNPIQQKSQTENNQKSLTENQQKSLTKKQLSHKNLTEKNQNTTDQKVISSNRTHPIESPIKTTSHSNQYSFNVQKPSHSVAPKPKENNPSLPVSNNIPGALSKPINIVTPATSKSAISLPVNNEACISPNLSHQQPRNKDKEIRLETEVESLKSQLEVQLQVNSELKRLLLASMGEELKDDVEKLARDKAQLSLELGDHVRKMTEDYEHLDKISIQADMWRSKFLASRVMIDELANAKAFYSLQYQESQDVLQQLLNERHEIRTSLLEGYNEIWPGKVNICDLFYLMN
ncbi:hypothetical protein LOTGIDRAFT_158759 [Lottia gigantea]|uniref:Golgin-45 n=1 Tax=Lottia gigantea TaxID=225164 RepID=V4A4G0_LOTGI|nr:hypothetical protein LOTGIDRAFT_158759 [Lottia gigantea]ESO98808.1 hypothetical protein LOTGIDRAFT_158759 [Lottia gigantea]